MGVHELVFDSKQPQLEKLTPGEYELVVEAAREVGGRELVKIPFTWPAATPSAATPSAATPATAKPRKLEARGQRELGAITLEVRP